eukprot:5077776-Pleurochrysis_carterae.AAC.1
MQGWGAGKLETVSEEQLLLALVENSLPLPLDDEPEKAAYAKQQLLRRFKHRNYAGWKQRLQAERKTIKGKR